MKKEALEKILEDNRLYINTNKKEGQRAYLRGAYLRGAYLQRADLQYANLEEADLQYANLEEANLQRADLEEANLQRADLEEADLQYANLQCANLIDANLQGADLRDANLCGANLQGADLRRANLRGANLRGANFQRANLRYANLQRANLCSADLQGAYLYLANLLGTNLSQVKNSPFFNQYNWLCKNFEKDREGFFVYKSIGNTQYMPPKSWKIEIGEFIEEEVDTNRTNSCGCGVNFGTKEFCTENYPNSDLWLCKLYIKDLIDTCVPIYTDGKARCGRLQLLQNIL